MYLGRSGIALDAQEITARLNSHASVLILQLLEQTGSTNSDLMACIKQENRPLFRLAIAQTAGRGRAGRTWHAHPGGMLCFSLAWQFHGGLSQLQGLPLAVGVAIAECLTSLDVPVQLKWPNDVLKQNKKIAGILLESTPALEGTWAIIGVGLNLIVPEELEQRIGQEVADSPWLAQMNPNHLIAHLLNHLCTVLNAFEQAGFAQFVDRWNQLHAFAGQTVQVMEQTNVLLKGLAVGVDEQGQLVVQTETGLQKVAAGDVSLRMSV